MHICILLYFWQVVIYLKFPQNHILYEELKDVVTFLNNSIQANYNYFVVCVCTSGKKSNMLTCVLEKKVQPCSP